jgi:hypothetical protein
MYLVISRWEVIPGHEEQAAVARIKMRDVMRQQPGVEFINGFSLDDGKLVAVHVYSDEDAYKAIVGDPDGPFAKAAAENKIEEHMQWISSERGAAID